jgi:hypothetical protein
MEVVARPTPERRQWTTRLDLTELEKTTTLGALLIIG